MKNEDRPRVCGNPFADVAKCGAKTRSGTPCQSPAMANGRCRLHGGKSTGPPKGNQNAYKHGFYTKRAIEFRRKTKALLKETNELLKDPTQAF